MLQNLTGHGQVILHSAGPYAMEYTEADFMDEDFIDQELRFEEKENIDPGQWFFEEDWEEPGGDPAEFQDPDDDAGSEEEEEWERPTCANGALRKDGQPKKRTGPKPGTKYQKGGTARRPSGVRRGKYVRSEAMKERQRKPFAELSKTSGH
jgi:hypothetical protein